MKKTLVVMAAGMGSRYGGLKQLDRIGPSGETIIDYSIFDALKAGFTKLVFIIRRDIETEFRRQVGSKFPDRMEVEYVFQELEDLPAGFTCPPERSKPWGTGQALLAAKEVISDPFLIINADDFYGLHAFMTASHYMDGMDPSGMEAALVAFLLANTLSEFGSVARGICKTDEKDYLIDVDEVLGIRRDGEGSFSSDSDLKLKGNDLVSMNMWVFTPRIFERSLAYFIQFLETQGNSHKGEFYIPTIVKNLIRDKEAVISVLRTESQWHGVTYREDKPDVVAFINSCIRNGFYPADLWGQS